ncbi:MAG: GIY-YIG nuclease family protein [Gemmatimonadaceae bacterium]|nr:GIY-YIG nuclease family protein [Gemmatimonadaceae bacterium]
MPALKADPDAERLAALRAHVRAGAEERPGVYRMITETGEVAYVGKSRKLRTRLLSYFRGEFPRDKSARIVREAHRIEWTYVPSEFASLLEELRLIKMLRPRLNVAQKRDDRNYGFVRLTSGRAPRLTVTRGSGAADRGGTYYGPFVGTANLQDALRELSAALGLRDCTLDGKMRFSDQMELLPAPPRTPGCLRFEIGTCLGPCVGAPTASAYGAQVHVARAFLDGTSDVPLVQLESAMRAASDRLEYERAGILRNRWQLVESLRERFSRLRFAVESLSFVYLVPGHAGEDRFYLVRRGVIRDDFAAPQSPDEWEAARARVRQVFAATHDVPGAVPSHDVDELLLVTSWFATKPEELDATIPPATLLERAD